MCIMIGEFVNIAIYKTSNLRLAKLMEMEAPWLNVNKNYLVTGHSESKNMVQFYHSKMLDLEW